ncbi:YceI family protein [Thioclava sp. BHET1]|nr:YceI family protein [Thioclava sp. BHET1]
MQQGSKRMKGLCGLWALCLGISLLATPGHARPASYVFEQAGSRIGFHVDFAGSAISGEIPLSASRLLLDFQDVQQSQISVTLAPRDATASFPFAAQAMRGPRVLDAAAYPAIRFVSTKVTLEGKGAAVAGALTIRDVTRPVILHATFWRPPGTGPSDLDHLILHLSGAINRADFGASGWSPTVGDRVTLDILARIRKQE